MKVAVLAGGVGGARFLRALTETADPASITGIVNVGDDLEIAGLHVAPDLDTVLYTLAGLSDEERGWGRAGETWHALETLRELGGDAWFALGDRDLGLHLARTQALRAGEPLSAVTTRLAAGA
ncbi:MAG TPA: 2-phospho-L-lactate transferase CofD family protein, partial [Gaiellaceae bacterium]|nr:2-phospho-L-lactate transferase CofD family protein [Gaiellaceae bacterium]